MKKRKIKLDNSPKGPAVELLADGQQCLVAGSHSSGVRYQWSPSLPEQIPTLSQEVVNRTWATLTQTYATTSSKLENQIAQDPLTSQLTQTKLESVLSSISDTDWNQLIGALRFLTDKVADNDTWSEIGYALLSLQATRPAEDLWISFSKDATGYEEGAPERWWETHRNQSPRVDYRYIINQAHRLGLPRIADVSAFTPVEQPDTEQTDNGIGGDSGASAGPDVGLVSDAPLKPLLQISSTRYAEIIDQLEGIMQPYLYVQGDHLVHQNAPHGDEEIRRSTDALMLVRTSREWVMKRSDEVAQWQKWQREGKGKWVNTEPSTKHVNALFNQGSWTQLRPLDAIARSPFVRPDGSICDTPGYDRRSRVLYVPNAVFPEIPLDPDRDSASRALERIRGVFDQFPWKEPASESAFLSHILSEVARLAIDRCPMYFYDAPSAGTGKGLLQEMAARIVHGSDPALRAWVGEGDEIRKALYAAVLAGDRSLWFDNLPDGHKTRSAELCAFITSSTWTDRKLGESESIGVPNRLILVASGNNITPTGDLARRSLVVRIDANTEHMKYRVFKIPMLRRYVMDHRPELLVAALTIIRAYTLATLRDGKISQGMPVTLPSFEEWSHLCRDPLIWLGLPDPIVTQENETDDESGDVGAIFAMLYAQFGEREFTSLDIARHVNGLADASSEMGSEMMQNGCREPNNPTKVGYWLRGYRDRISNGIKLRRGRRDGHGAKWQFERVEELA
jgi:hypothetical protein